MLINWILYSIAKSKSFKSDQTQQLIESNTETFFTHSWIIWAPKLTTLHTPLWSHRSGTLYSSYPPLHCRHLHQTHAHGTSPISEHLAAPLF